MLASDSMNDPDRELVAQVKSGNKAIFGQLAEHYYDMVYAVAYGVLNHHEAARDVAQEVFLKAFRDIDQFEGAAKFKTWLYRIAVNAAIDQGRKKRPMQSLDATDESDDEDRPPVIIEDKSPNPRDRAVQSELRDRLNQALEELSPEHRAVLVLREWQELSYEEIAEALDVQIGTVMSRLFYARKKMVEILNAKDKERVSE